MFNEYDKVKTLVDKDKYPSGMIGIIVSIYTSGPACEVELWDKDENPIDVVTYEFSEIKKIRNDKSF